MQIFFQVKKNWIFFLRMFFWLRLKRGQQCYQKSRVRVRDETDMEMQKQSRKLKTKKQKFWKYWNRKNIKISFRKNRRQSYKKYICLKKTQIFTFTSTWLLYCYDLNWSNTPSRNLLILFLLRTNSFYRIAFRTIINHYLRSTGTYLQVVLRNRVYDAHKATWLKQVHIISSQFWSIFIDLK